MEILAYEIRPETVQQIVSESIEAQWLAWHDEFAKTTRKRLGPEWEVEEDHGDR